MRRTATAVLCMLIPAGLSAQNPPRPDTVFPLPGLTVTAARTPLRVLDVPLAVTVVDRSQLANRNGLRLDQAFFGVPGVLAQSRFGGSDIRIVIRGFGARGAGDRSNAGTTRGVRILTDGFPETEPDGRTALDLIDLDATQSMEVIRSNASGLWGNAAGGLVNFTTVPEVGSRTASYQRAMGSFGLVRDILQGAAPIGAGEVYGSAIWSEFDGWRVNSQSSRKLVNLGMVAPLGDNTELRASAIAADNRFNIPGPLTLAQLEADPDQANAAYLARRERRWNRVGRVGLALDHGTNNGGEFSAMLFVNPKYLQRSERGTYRDFTRYHIGGNAMYRLPTNYTSSLKGSLTVGADEAYQDGAILFYTLSATNERGTTLRDNKREGANNVGIFAQQLLTFSPKIDVSLGARYDDISYYNNSFIDPNLDDRKSFSRITPKLGIAFHLQPDQTIYANMGGGVEAPAGNETDPPPGGTVVTSLNPLLEPISSTTFEVGTKQLLNMSGSGFVHAVSYDLALYRTNVTNEIVPYQGGRFYFTAAKAERMGAELGVHIMTAPGLGINGALTVSDNRYRDYVVDSVHYSRPGASADYSDNKIVGVPGTFYNVGATYTPSFLNVAQLQLEMQGSGDYFADDANNVNVPGYTMFNAGVALNNPVRLGAGLGLRGFVRVENITDRKFVASAFLNPDLVGGSAAAFEPGAPRHFVVSASLGWTK